MVCGSLALPACRPRGGPGGGGARVACAAAQVKKSARRGFCGGRGECLRRQAEAEAPNDPSDHPPFRLRDLGGRRDATPRVWPVNRPACTASLGQGYLPGTFSRDMGNMPLLLATAVALACLVASESFAVPGASLDPRDDRYESPLDEVELAAHRSMVSVLPCARSRVHTGSGPCRCLRMLVHRENCAADRSLILCAQAGARKVAALKVKYAGSFDAKSTSWVIITSVNPPTTQVERICSIQGWNKVIVADKKTPKDWSSNGCFFLSVEDQEELEYKIHASLPYMRYERKMLGYLFAVEMGAEIILGPTPPPLFVHYRSSRPHWLPLSTVQHVRSSKHRLIPY